MGGSHGEPLSPVRTPITECLPGSIFLLPLWKPTLRAIQLFVPIELVIPLLEVYCKEINYFGRRNSYTNKKAAHGLIHYLMSAQCPTVGEWSGQSVSTFKVLRTTWGNAVYNTGKQTACTLWTASMFVNKWGVGREIVCGEIVYPLWVRRCPKHFGPLTISLILLNGEDRHCHYQFVH